MKAEKIPLLLVKYKSKIDEKMPRYHAILERWYPEKMKSPLERFKASSWYFNDKTEAENLKTFDDIKELGGSIAEKFTDYSDIFEIALSNSDFTFGDLTQRNDVEYYSDRRQAKLTKDEIKFINKFKGHCYVYYILSILHGDIQPDGMFESKRYFDQSLTFNNETIVITDPCYVMNPRDGYSYINKNIRFDYIRNDTHYGDWGCTVYKDDKTELGKFCADSGQVAIFKGEQLTDEFFKWAKEHSWCVTVIPNFTGTVEIIIEIMKEKYLSRYSPFECYVKGTGNINFKSTQTEP